MRISVKGRYGLAAMITLAGNDPNEYLPIMNISNKLGISKIYLEQVFSLLKRSGLVVSIKGAQGGYQLSRPAKEISVFSILSATELTLFEKTESTVVDREPILEQVMQSAVFEKLDHAIVSTLEAITLDALLDKFQEENDVSNFMFYI